MADVTKLCVGRDVSPDDDFGEENAMHTRSSDEHFLSHYFWAFLFFLHKSLEK